MRRYVLVSTLLALVLTLGGCIASDKRSALLDLGAVEKLLRSANGSAELSLAWEVTQ